MTGKITTRPGFVDKYRRSLPGVGRVENESLWGQERAYSRTAQYRRGQTDVAPPMPKPTGPELGYESPSNREVQGRARDWADDVPKNSWLRGGGSQRAEAKPNFDHRGNPNNWRGGNNPKLK